MTRSCPLTVWVPLFLGLLATLSCGNSDRKLESVTLDPPAADAKNSPNGQVQFLATGTFSQPPSPAPLTSKDVAWCVGEVTSAMNPTAGMCVGNVVPFATVDQNGLAKCSPSSQGTVYILAGTPGAMVMPDEGSQLKVFGSAQLTCP